MSNYHRQCFQRDGRLVDLLNEWGVLDTEQIQYLLFPSLRVAQRRLLILSKQGIIRRNIQTSPYFYYMVVHKNPLERININWVRLWVASQCKSWERITMDYQTGTCTVKNTYAKTEKEYIITNKKFKMPGDNIIPLTDEWINKIREELKCLK